MYVLDKPSSGLHGHQGREFQGLLREISPSFSHNSSTPWSTTVNPGYRILNDRKVQIVSMKLFFQILKNIVQVYSISTHVANSHPPNKVCTSCLG